MAMADDDLTNAQMNEITQGTPRGLPTYVRPNKAQVRAGRKKINRCRRQKSEEYLGRISASVSSERFAVGVVLQPVKSVEV
jgi:hypothetical protein